MPWDFDALEKEAGMLLRSGSFAKAREIYLVMGDGDPSPDARYLGYRIGLTYEGEGRLMAAKYWFNSALEENPEIDQYKAALAKYKSYYPRGFLNVVPNP